jgi:hypothetical protein
MFNPPMYPPQVTALQQRFGRNPNPANPTFNDGQYGGIGNVPVGGPGGPVPGPTGVMTPGNGTAPNPMQQRIGAMQDSVGNGAQISPQVMALIQQHMLQQQQAGQNGGMVPQPVAAGPGMNPPGGVNIAGFQVPSTPQPGPNSMTPQQAQYQLGLNQQMMQQAALNGGGMNPQAAPYQLNPTLGMGQGGGGLSSGAGGLARYYMR